MKLQIEEAISIWRDIFDAPNPRLTDDKGKPIVDITNMPTLRFRGIDYQIKLFANGKCRGVDIVVDGIPLRCIEQNPNKITKPGMRARKGARIVWFIPPQSNDQWRRVEEGLYYIGNDAVPIYPKVKESKNNG